MTDTIRSLRAERDEARQIVRDIHWMARRYADGRMSYAVGMFNDAVRKGFDAGWLEWKMDDQEPRYARDAMFSVEWKGMEQRLVEAQAELATARRESTEAAVAEMREAAAREAEAYPFIARAIRNLPLTPAERPREDGNA